MKRTIISILSVLTLTVLFLAGCTEKSAVSPISSNTDNSAGTYLIMMNAPQGGSLQSAGAAKSQILSFINSHGIASENVKYIYTNVANGFAAQLTTEQVAALRNDAGVSLVEKDQEFRLVDNAVESVMSGSDPRTQSQTLPWGINYVGGPRNYTGSNEAWIVDTGIDLTHPDLNVDVAKSRSFVSSGTDATTPNDGNGHGTHVSGTIAAKNDYNGVVGVAAGARVVAVKVLSSTGSGWTTDIVAGLDYVYANGRPGDVINMSLGGGASTYMDNAVLRVASKGIFCALAAGNSSTSATTTSPARVNGTNIYTVSAHDRYGVFAYFSNYGNPPIDFSAPGVSVYSTYKGGSYATMSGTSMATPHVAGILLANGGRVNYSGYVTGDRDATPDKKAHL